MSNFCYNRGCQKKYTPTNDSSKDDIACLHHPGLPYFHDAYKIWSCCQKKSHDFTTFLSIPGCANGPHQPNKPEEPATPQEEQAPPPKPVVRQEISRPQMPAVERPPSDAPLVKMKLTVANSLRTALDKLTNVPKADTSEKEQTNDEIKPGTACKHATCGARYTTADEEQSTRCKFHPGVPIFHEGMKYWSCCQKKTTDFEAFTSQAGCAEGEHLWRAETQPSSSNEDDPQLLKTSCRYDFHQQGSSVVLSIYAKMPRPEQTQVELNAGRLKVNTQFGTDSTPKRFFNEWELFGLVDVNQITVELLQTKIEIILKKAEPLSWSRLDRP